MAGQHNLTPVADQRHVIVPTLHLNGSSAEDLLEQLRDATAALDSALGKLALASPHGRDYYVQSDDAFSRALNEHTARVEALTKVRGEVATIARAVYAQQLERAKNRRP